MREGEWLLLLEVFQLVESEELLAGGGDGREDGEFGLHGWTLVGGGEVGLVGHAVQLLSERGCVRE